jgi:heat shock protein HslJ
MHVDSRFGRAVGATSAAVVVAVLLLASAGCTTPPAQTLVGSWRITGVPAVAGGAPAPLIAGTAISLQVNDDGSLEGFACNGYGGNWAATDQLAITGIIHTDRFCSSPTGASAQETRYYRALAAARTWSVTDSGLTLFDANGRPVITAVRALGGSGSTVAVELELT